MGDASSGSIPPGDQPSRRRHLRGWPQNRGRARPLPRMVVFMSAAYEAVTAGAAGLEFRVRNESGETWRAADGFAISYHLFDAETGTLLVDGVRVHPESDVQPGESMPVKLRIDLPPEDGQYQALISPMRESVC